MHTSKWRVEPGSLTTWTKVMRGSEQDGDLEIVAKTYAIEGYSAADVAHLIAAAPEMLAALRFISSRSYTVPAADVIDNARAALAKAEGRRE